MVGAERDLQIGRNLNSFHHYSPTRIRKHANPQMGPKDTHSDCVICFDRSKRVLTESRSSLHFGYSHPHPHLPMSTKCAKKITHPPLKKSQINNFQQNWRRKFKFIYINLYFLFFLIEFTKSLVFCEILMSILECIGFGLMKASSFICIDAHICLWNRRPPEW